MFSLKLRKPILIAVCFVLLVIPLSACVNNSSDGNATPPKGDEASGKAKDEDVTLKFWYWDESFDEIMKESIKEFNKENPKIKVETTIVPWDQWMTKLQVSIPSATGPDIFWVTSDQGVILAPLNTLKDLTPFIEKDNFDVTSYNEDMIKAYWREGGKTYGIPKDFSMDVFFYNKAIFDGNNVEYPKEGWTWDDLLDKAKKLTKEGADGEIETYGFVASPNEECLDDFIYQGGGRIYNDDLTQAVVNSPENAKTLNYLMDMIDAHKVSPPIDYQYENDFVGEFANGNVAMIVSGSWVIEYVAEALGEDVGIAPMPIGAKSTSVISGQCYSISETTKYSDEAWELVKFLCKPEIQGLQAELTIPAHKDVITSYVDAYKDMIDFSVLLDEVPKASVYEVPKKATMEVMEIKNDYMHKIWNKDISIEGGLAEMEEKMNELLNK